MGGGIGRVEMLKNTNILCLVGGGKKPKYPLNKIIIWDDNITKVIGEIRFNLPVLNVRIKMDRIIGVTEKNIYGVNINTLDLIDMYETYENTNGVVALSTGDLVSILAFPAIAKGKVKLVNCLSSTQPPSVQAHESKIACLSINEDGSLLATASDKGTLIRIFHIQNGNLIGEFRRGTKNAVINFIAFDIQNRYLGCTSDSGTVHIFNLINAIKNMNEGENDENEEEPKNQKGIFNKFLLKLKKDTLSFAKLRIQENKSIICFLNDVSFICLTCQGKYYLASFDPKSNEECAKINEFNFLNKRQNNNKK